MTSPLNICHFKSSAKDQCETDLYMYVMVGGGGGVEQVGEALYGPAVAIGDTL